MNTLIAIAVAGAIGSVSRYLLGRAAQGVAHVRFPLGTLLVNVIGCALVGIVARYFLNDETQPVIRAALIIGFCGGFTTFSTFSLETLGLIVAGDWPRALTYAVASTILCIAATAGGYQVVLRR